MARWLGRPGQPNDHGRAAWREPELCAGCHGGAGEALCVGCHKVGGIGGKCPHCHRNLGAFVARRGREISARQVTQLRLELILADAYQRRGQLIDGIGLVGA